MRMLGHLPRSGRDGSEPRESEGREAGETLIELLATLMVVGLAVAAILAIILTTVLVSNVHRRRTSSSTQAFSFAEDILRTDDEQPYVPCTPGQPGAAGYYDYGSPMAGYQVKVQKVEFLVSRSSSTAEWQTSCPAIDQGAQRILIQVHPADRADEYEEVTLIKRDRDCGDGSGERC